MKRFILGIIIGLLAGTTISAIALNTGTPRSSDVVLNSAWNTVNNTLTCIGV